MNNAAGPGLSTVPTVEDPSAAQPLLRPRKPRSSPGVYVQGLVTAAVLGVLTNFGNQGPSSGLPAGYSAGTGDHYVLSQVGLHWADESRYAGDWFMQSAPQPHWFFDTLTFVGSSLGILSLVYLLFWFGGLFAFGLAAAFISRVWAPGAPWAFGLATTVVASLTPWAIVGTGSSMISLAIPAVVSANLVFLFIASALSGRSRWMLAAAVLTAVVHVQQGAVVAVLLGAIAVVQFVRQRKLSKATAVTFAATVGIVVAALVARPVAANSDDFIEICNRVIPYHCAAQSWSINTLLASFAVIGLALCTFMYQARGDRMLWGAVVLLPMAGLALGMTANMLSVPVFGELAQAVNVYRLGALVLPFAVMGMLLPFFRLGKGHLLVTLVPIVLSISYLDIPQWQLNRGLIVPFMIVFALGALAAVIVRSRMQGPSGRVSQISAAGIIVLFLASAITTGGLTARPLDPTYIPNADVREWGEAVEAVVPSGESLLAPPLANYVRAATYRGVIADCKNVPYGGEPWQQWQERLTDLGGTKQCIPANAGFYNSMTPISIDRVADKYGVSYMVVEAGQAEWLSELDELGWDVVLEPTSGLDNFILHKSG